MFASWIRILTGGLMAAPHRRAMHRARARLRPSALSHRRNSAQQRPAMLASAHARQRRNIDRRAIERYAAGRHRGPAGVRKSGMRQGGQNVKRDSVRFDHLTGGHVDGFTFDGDGLHDKVPAGRKSALWTVLYLCNLRWLELVKYKGFR